MDEEANKELLLFIFITGGRPRLEYMYVKKKVGENALKCQSMYRGD